MAKVKEKLYEHRFGLFFFVFLIAYSFIVSGNMRAWKINDVTYSVYAVDFSMGFCTKILPGAIYSFIFDKVDENLITIYSIVLLLLFFAGISFLSGRLVKKTEEEKRQYVFVMMMFFLTGPCTFSLSITTLGFLDFYWLLGVLMFFLCLSKKQLYVFILPIFLYMVMIYYSSIICYLPFLVIVMLYKISCTQEKKEKYYLTAILAISFVSMMGLFFYMILFETDNLVYSMEDFNSILKARGVTHFNYYDFSFYRKSAEITYESFFGDAVEEAITEIDRTGSPIKAFIQMVVQQIQINMRIVDIKRDIKYLVIVIPVVAMIFKSFVVWIRKNKKDLLKNFALSCSLALFIVTISLGNLFSTDGVRWYAYAYMPLLTTFFYVWWNEKEFQEETKKVVSKIPVLWILPYFVLYAATTTSF